MGRSLIAFALGLAVAAALAPAALAKEGGIELSSTPFGTPPGGTWTTNLRLIDLNGRPPVDPKPRITVTNLGTGEQNVFVAKQTGSADYVVDVVFPTAGRYSYTAADGVTDREYTYPPVRIVGAGTAVPAPSSGGNGSFPVWAPVTGGLALLLAAVGAGAWARRRRLGLSH
ncbi:MAG TPA: hypothetical protein VFW80_02490 [Gaiellaceae bacterium]|nr:hypothetical protein [Gaiellaceae bacterium]